MNCNECGDTGVIEVDFEGSPRSAWEALPIESQAAYRMGLVEFTERPCWEKCEATKEAAS